MTNTETELTEAFLQAVPELSEDLDGLQRLAAWLQKWHDATGEPVSLKVMLQGVQHLDLLAPHRERRAAEAREQAEWDAKQEKLAEQQRQREEWLAGPETLRQEIFDEFRKRNVAPARKEVPEFSEEEYAKMDAAQLRVALGASRPEDAESAKQTREQYAREDRIRALKRVTSNRYKPRNHYERTVRTAAIEELERLGRKS